MKKMLVPCLILAVLSSCGGGGGSSSSTTSSAATTSAAVSSSSSVASSTASSTAVTSSSVSSASSSTVANASCTGGTYVENVVCAVNAFAGTLTSSQLAVAQYSNSTYSAGQLNVYKTQWSNLPGVTRAGIAYSNLTTTAQTNAFYAVAAAALTSAGYADFDAVLAADDYLGTKQNGYGRGYAHIAIIGTPSTTGLWTLSIGNHHMAYLITFNNGSAYPTPHHIAVEPKATFTVNDKTYTALADKAGSMLGVFYGKTDSLSSTQLSSARLTTSFSDILIGPVEKDTGSYSTVAAKFPTGTSNRGILVSSLSAAQKAMVTAAITQWVSDYNSGITADLLSAYTSDTAYASTYIAWSGSSSLSYPNVDTNNTYMRIDGPRAWIEIACQGGIVIQGQTHYHMIFRDKTTDYYNELSTN